MVRPHSSALSAARIPIPILRTWMVLARVFEEGTQMREDLQRMI